MKTSQMFVIGLCVVTSSFHAIYADHTADDKVPAGASAVLKKAAELVGYQAGPNKDSIFGDWYGQNHQNYCAMFVSWCFNQTGQTKLVACQSPKGFAHCATALNWFANKKQLVTDVKEARGGDVVFFSFDDNTTPVHVGIVYKNFPDKSYMLTYEGNTSAPGSNGSQRSGGGVYLKTRSYKCITAVVRPKYKS